MSHIELLSKNEKMIHWKQLREEIIKIKEDVDVLIKVEQFWDQWATVQWYMDYDHTDTWLTPWEVLNDDCLCKSSLAYMMYWTLNLADDLYWSNERLSLKLIQDDTKEIFLILVIDNKYVLNYSHRELSEFDKIKNNIRVISNYTKTKTGFDECVVTQ